MSKFLLKYRGENSEEQKDQLIKQGVNHILNEDLRKEFEQDLKDQFGIHPNPGKRKVLPLKSIISIAASLAILVTLFFLLDNPSSQDLALQYSQESMVHPGATKGVSQEDIMIRTEAIRLYNNQEYREAYEKFTTLPESTEQDILFAGIAAVKAQAYDDAILLLSSPEIGASSVYREEFRWYLALAFLLNNQELRASDLLNQIEPDDWKYADAQKLLKKIKD